MDIKIPRSEIIDILRKWQSGKMTVDQVKEWAEERYQDDEDKYLFTDFEGKPESSVSVEIMANLSAADLYLVTVDDIPEYIAFLETPVGSFLKGYKRFAKYHNSIDYDARIEKIKKIPFYAEGCELKMYPEYKENPSTTFIR
jgi:hypothetical protein